MIVGSFGNNLIFQVQKDKVLTPQSVKRIVEATYEEHAVLQTKPRLEFIAPKLEVITLSVLFSVSLGVNPRESMQIATEILTKGTVENLILGGKNYGTFVLTKAEESWSQSTQNGIPMSIKADFEFKEYVQ